MQSIKAAFFFYIISLIQYFFVYLHILTIILYNMKIDKLFKRFLKDSGVYGSKTSKEVINFMNEYDEIGIPFNAFRWETSNEGHMFWYSKALGWVIFMLDNADAIADENNVCIEDIKGILYELIQNYDNDAPKEQLNKIDEYVKAQKMIIGYEANTN